MQYQKEDGDTLDLSCEPSTLRGIHVRGSNIHSQAENGKEATRECNFTMTITSDERTQRGNHVSSVRIRNLNRAVMEGLRNKLNEELERLESEGKVEKIIMSFNRSTRDDHPGIVADALKEAGCLTAAKEWDQKVERVKQLQIQEQIKQEALAKLKAAGIKNPTISIY